MTDEREALAAAIHREIQNGLVLTIRLLKSAIADDDDFPALEAEALACMEKVDAMSERLESMTTLD